jgi:hypothetical protein
VHEWRSRSCASPRAINRCDAIWLSWEPRAHRRTRRCRDLTENFTPKVADSALRSCCWHRENHACRICDRPETAWRFARARRVTNTWVVRASRCRGVQRGCARRSTLHARVDACCEGTGSGASSDRSMIGHRGEMPNCVESRHANMLCVRYDRIVARASAWTMNGAQ